MGLYLLTPIFRKKNMFTRTITYRKLNGDQVTKDFYFNLSVDEAIEEELEYGKEGLEGHLKKVLEANDGKELYRIFKRLILKSYGERHEDGERFVKSDELSEAFTQTDAFSVFIMDLTVDTKLATDFFNGIIPTEAIRRIEEVREKEGLPSARSDEPAWIKENRDPTDQELRTMSKDQMAFAMRRKLGRA